MEILFTREYEGSNTHHSEKVQSYLLCKVHLFEENQMTCHLTHVLRPSIVLQSKGRTPT